MATPRVTMQPRPINFRTLDLNLLKVFDAVMLERNVTRAAARLAMTQPAVSNALRRLREATHEELFLPSAGGVMPTLHAQGLWPTVSAALDRLQEAFEPQGFDPQQDSRNFTLAMADATAALVMPTLARALQTQQAQVNLRVQGLSTRDPRPLLEQGQCDVALGFFPEVQTELAAQADQAVMRLDPLYACDYVGVMRQGHALAAPGAWTLPAYCAADHVRVSFHGRAHGFVDAALSRLGLQRRVMLTVSHFFTAVLVLQQTDLVAVLPRGFVNACGAQAQLVVRPLPFVLPDIEIDLLWHRRHERDTAQRWLRDLLKRAAVPIAASL
jgi:DNA-binding transcriptional LysR family regulator